MVWRKGETDGENLDKYNGEVAFCVSQFTNALLLSTFYGKMIMFIFGELS